MKITKGSNGIKSLYIGHYSFCILHFILQYSKSLANAKFLEQLWKWMKVSNRFGLTLITVSIFKKGSCVQRNLKSVNIYRISKNSELLKSYTLLAH